MKPRRDITLGEMQDECKKYWNNGNLGSCGKCQYMEVCCHYEAYAPAQLNLTDPPRFTEAQMTALSESYASGVTKISKTKYALHFVIPSIMSEIVVGNIGLAEILEVGETLDLAELLRKDGADGTQGVDVFAVRCARSE